MNLRELKALEIAARSRITFDDGRWTVPSQSGNAPYTVVLGTNAATCTCEDHTTNGWQCKHIMAVRLVLERECGGTSPVVVDAVPKKPTIPRDFSLYNEVQQTEKNRFRRLLFDLTRGLEEPERARTGRTPTPLVDRAYSSVFKVFSTLSSRRFACDLRDAYERGYLSKRMNSVTICSYLESDALTPVLKALLVRSSLPLKAVESVFAPDSTGFSSSRFVRWFDEKYGVEKSGHDWVKVHAMSGVKTNIVTAVEIGDRDAADCPLFKHLVETTARTFGVKEVVADKAYLSRENLEQVERLGGTAYVPFRSNSIAGEAGTLWEKMFHYYHLHRDEFLRHYHQRSNAESTFSAVKAKFGDSIRSRTDVAMKNEALAKFVAHNICVVHRSHIELGIEPVFWGEAEAEEGPMMLTRKRACKETP